MSNWKVENRLTGEVVHAYGADAPDHFTDYPLEQFNHILQKPVDADPIPRTVTKLEYLRRFTGEERVTTRNGYAVVGKPSCAVSSANDNTEIGEKIAVTNSREELWPLMGYALKAKLAEGGAA